MDGAELRRRLQRLGRPYTELAALLGLSPAGLHKQMNAQRPVSRQTELLLERIEADHEHAVRYADADPPPKRRLRASAGR